MQCVHSPRISRQASKFSIHRRTLLKRATALGVSLRLPTGASAAGGEVNFYNWRNNIGDSTLDEFSASSGVAVHYELFADNEELFARLRGGNSGYDVVVPGNDYVERMLHTRLLQPLNHTRMPALKDIASHFLNPPFDPGRQFSVPYLWGSVGIGYRKSAVSKVPTSWNELFTSSEYAGRIAFLNDPVIVMRLAMKAMGMSLNDLSDTNVLAAEAMIKKQRSNIVAFAPDNGQDLLLAGEADLVMEWNSDILRVMADDDDIGYSLPEEGGLLWEDSLCIPAGAPNVGNAHALINYLVSADTQVSIASQVQQATPLNAAPALMGSAYASNPALSPSTSALQNSEFPLSPSPQTLLTIQQSWSRL